jgi:aminopeptidase N
MKNKIIYLKDYKIPHFLIKKIDLIFDLYDDYTIVTSDIIFYKNVKYKDNNKLILD